MRPILIGALILSARVAAQQSAAADRFLGNWQGALDVGAQKLRLALSVTRDETGVHATLTSLDQGNAAIPASVSFSGDTLVLTMTAAGARYATIVVGDSLRG